MATPVNDFDLITDPNERRRLALAEIDAAPFGWYHVRACIVAGVGFFTDAYDLFVVSNLTIMLGIVFWPQAKGKMPTSADTAIKVSTSAGTVIGQVGFGALADIFGRKRMYGIELITFPCRDSVKYVLNVTAFIIFTDEYSSLLVPLSCLSSQLVLRSLCSPQKPTLLAQVFALWLLIRRGAFSLVSKPHGNVLKGMLI